MIGCDNPNCKIEWFHFACLKITEAPKGKRKWYCPDCRILPGFNRSKQKIVQLFSVFLKTVIKGNMCNLKLCNYRGSIDWNYRITNIAQCTTHSNNVVYYLHLFASQENQLAMYFVKLNTFFLYFQSHVQYGS